MHNTEIHFGFENGTVQLKMYHIFRMFAPDTDRGYAVLHTTQIRTLYVYPTVLLYKVGRLWGVTLDI